MKRTFKIDDALLREAKLACGAKTDTETIHLGLEVLLRQAASQRLRSFRGTERHMRDVPQRREAPSRDLL